MHILVVGLGNMGKKYLVKLEELGKRLVLCDRDPEKGTNNHPFYCHLEDIQEEVGAVIIAVDPKDHVRLSKGFLEKGIPVLLEKPPALSSKEFMEIHPYANLYISEIESFSSCLRLIPREGVKSISIERLGKGKGYVSPLWDLAWHDLYLLQNLFKEVEVEDLRVDHVWELRGRVDNAEFSIKVAWEHPNPSRRWVIDGGSIVIDLAKEEVWEMGRLVHRGNTDKLRSMLESFLSGNFDSKSKDRAMKNILLLEGVK
ncbi:Gfo/Idh/MocA family protein [Thermocrinis sp.]